MRSLILTVSVTIGVCPTLANTAQHPATAASRLDPSHPATFTAIPCETQIRYDDGEDSFPGGPGLGWFSDTQYQFLGVRFTPPAGEVYRVQSASWFSDFWNTPGLVDVTAMEADNPGNAVTVTVNVTDGGTWGVEFPNPICIPAGTDYFIMLCPHPGVQGEVGDDWSAPDERSWFSAPGFFITGCVPANQWANDHMIWSCAAPCISTTTQTPTWGHLKTIYR